MEKTYDALLERLRKSAEWHKKLAEDMERQPGLNDTEKEIIIEEKAIASYINTVLRVEVMA